MDSRKIADELLRVAGEMSSILEDDEIGLGYGENGYGNGVPLLIRRLSNAMVELEKAGIDSRLPERDLHSVGNHNAVAMRFYWKSGEFLGNESGAEKRERASEITRDLISRLRKLGFKIDSELSDYDMTGPSIVFVGYSVG